MTLIKKEAPVTETFKKTPEEKEALKKVKVEYKKKYED